MHSYPDIKLLINGEWRDALSGKTIEVLDPATDETLGTIAHAEKADLDRRWTLPTRASRSGAKPPHSSVPRSCARLPISCASASTTSHG